jgi:arginine-tRNA-protein transferase
VEIGTPRVDQERLDLYHAWHASREEARGWTPSELDARAYFTQFAFPHPAAREVTIRDPERGDRLVGVGLSDETPAAWSAIYFFYDPSYAERSIGVFNVLSQIAVARAHELPHLYLGFRISACPSMRYKSRFHPQEVLVGRPGDDEEPRWVLSPREPSDP